MNGQIVRDRYGIAVGGIRTPVVGVPVEVLSGDGNTGDPFCRLYGSTVPLAPGVLSSLYRNHGAYVSQVGASAREAQRQGRLLAEDASTIRQEAAQSRLGKKQ